jgi:hypothetical protein
MVVCALTPTPPERRRRRSGMIMVAVAHLGNIGFPLEEPGPPR